MVPTIDLPARPTPREILALVLLWVCVSAFNVTKAVHIDDTAYLEIARAIRHDPLHAMRTELSWGHKKEPIHAVNQPHLFFYLLALSMSLFGDNEVAFHLVESAFTLGALAFFYLLSKRLCGEAPRRALYLSALFALGPALLPAQNVMCDVPMLACWLGFLWALLTPRRETENAGAGKLAYPLLAAGFAAAACLIKYTSLVLLPVLLIDLLWRGERRRLWVLAVPLAALGAWSLVNYLDYGSVHLLGREKVARDAESVLRRAVAFFICLGAVTPFSPLLLRRLPARGIGLVLVGIVTAVLLLARPGGWGEKPVWWPWLRAAFLANGLVVYGGCLLLLAGELRDADHEPGKRTHVAIVLTAWLLGGAAFIILFAPFLAVRHVLPMVPVALWLAGRQRPASSVGDMGVSGQAAVLAITAGLGAVLAVSDWLMADVYRRAPARLRAVLSNEGDGGRSSPTIWYVGHWGWQWYADRAGFRQYDPDRSALSEGDYLIVPELVPRQDVPPADWQRCRRIDTIVAPSGAWTVLRTVMKVPPGGYYTMVDSRALPWAPSVQPLEEFSLFRIGPAAP